MLFAVAKRVQHARKIRVIIKERYLLKHAYCFSCFAYYLPLSACAEYQQVHMLRRILRLFHALCF